MSLEEKAGFTPVHRVEITGNDLAETETLVLGLQENEHVAGTEEIRIFTERNQNLTTIVKKRVRKYDRPLLLLL